VGGRGGYSSLSLPKARFTFEDICLQPVTGKKIIIGTGTGTGNHFFPLGLFIFWEALGFEPQPVKDVKVCFQ